MGFTGYLGKKRQAIQLRKKGLSYKEILKKVTVSKGTLSLWLRDVKLSDTQLENLNLKKKNGGLKGSFLGAQKQLNKRKQSTVLQYKQGIKEVGILEKRDRFITGIALYASEGTKTDRVCEFTNADPEMIRFMSKWFREFCDSKESQFRGALWLHEGKDESLAKEYWSEISGISIDRIYKTYFVKNKDKSNKIRKNVHENGVFSIRYLDAKVSRKIIGWIAGLLGSAWYNNRIDKLHLLDISPVAQLVEQDAVNRQPSGVIRNGKRG